MRGPSVPLLLALALLIAAAPAARAQEFDSTYEDPAARALVAAAASAQRQKQAATAQKPATRTAVLRGCTTCYTGRYQGYDELREKMSGYPRVLFRTWSKPPELDIYESDDRRPRGEHVFNMPIREITTYEEIVKVLEYYGIKREPRYKWAKPQ